MPATCAHPMSHTTHDKISYMLFVNSDIVCMQRAITESLERIHTYIDPSITASESKAIEKLMEINIVKPRQRVALLFLLMRVDDKLCTDITQVTDTERNASLKAVCPHKAATFLIALEKATDDWLQNESRNINDFIRDIEDAYLCA